MEQVRTLDLYTYFLSFASYITYLH